MKKLPKENIVLLIGCLLFLLRLLFTINDGGFYFRMFPALELNEAASYELGNTLWQGLAIIGATIVLYFYFKKKPK